MIDSNDAPLNTTSTLTYTSILDESTAVVNEKENQRFMKHSALVTLLIMSIGPFSLIIQAIGEMLDMLMITKSFSDQPNSHAIEIIGFTSQIIGFSYYIGVFYGQAICARVSSLIGSGNRDAASHLITDSIYLCVLTSLIFVSIFIFIIRPFLKFLGTPDFMLNPTFKFLVPIYIATPFTSMVFLEQYFLQSIGNSILSGCVKVSVYVLQLAIFSPIFLFGLKVSTTFMKLGMICANIVVAVGMLVLMYKNKFSIDLNVRDFFTRFHPEVKKAVLAALPLLLSCLVYSLPQILILQTLTSVAKDYAKQIGGVFAVYTKLLPMMSEIPAAFSQSFLSTGTHAWGSGNPKRLIQLLLWTLLLNGSLTLIASVIVIINKSAIIKLFLSDIIEIKLAETMIPIPFYTITFQGLSMTLSFLNIVVGKPVVAFITQLTQMLILCFGCKIIAHYSKNVTNIMYIFNISDLFIFVLNLIFLAIPILAIKKKLNQDKNASINEKLIIE